MLIHSIKSDSTKAFQHSEGPGLQVVTGNNAGNMPAPEETSLMQLTHLNHWTPIKRGPVVL